MNTADIIIIFVLALIVGFAIGKIIKNKKSGKNCSCCNGDCSNCK